MGNHRRLALFEIVGAKRFINFRHSPYMKGQPMSSKTVVETDILVIGGGMAGVFAAVKSRDEGLDVVLVDKGSIGRSGLTPFARGFRWYNEEVNGAKEDFIAGSCMYGEYLNNRDYLKSYLDRSKSAYEDLASWGIFGNIQYAPSLVKAVKESGTRIMERTMMTDLIVKDGRAAGAVGFTMDEGRFVAVKAKAVIMCAGAGAFKPTGFPVSSLTSDGDAMSYRIGAEITGKEFVDPHATTQDGPADCWNFWGPHWSGGIWPGVAELERGLSLDSTLDNFFTTDLKKTPPNDPSGGIGRGQLYRNGEWVAAPRPGADESVIKGPYGEPPAPGPDRSKGEARLVGGASAGLGVHKAEGLWPVDSKCASNIAGLYAAGDGLGSMMLGTLYSAGGGSVSGSAVQGVMASESVAAYVKNMKLPVISKDELERLRTITFEPGERENGYNPVWVTQVLQNIVLPSHVLYVKSESRLKAALTNIEFIRDHFVPSLMAEDTHALRLAHETKNMVLNAEMKLRTSLFRTESRGNHYREDYPARDDENWLVWIKIKDGGGSMKLTKVPIPEAWHPDPQKPYEQRYPFRYPGELEYLNKKG